MFLEIIQGRNWIRSLFPASSLELYMLRKSRANSTFKQAAHTESTSSSFWPFYKFSFIMNNNKIIDFFCNSTDTNKNNIFF